MKLSKEEFLVLWQLEEGANFPEEVEAFINLNVEEIMKVFIKLEKEEIIKINKKYDEHNKKENWFAVLNKEKALPFYKEYKKWVPESW